MDKITKVFIPGWGGWFLRIQPAWVEGYRPAAIYRAIAA